jgi:ribosomal protein L33
MALLNSYRFKTKSEKQKQYVFDSSSYKTPNLLKLNNFCPIVSIKLVF